MPRTRLTGNTGLNLEGGKNSTKNDGNLELPSFLRLTVTALIIRAFSGHPLLQAQHTKHFSLSIIALFSKSVAPTGHTWAQTPHCEHLSLIAIKSTAGINDLGSLKGGRLYGYRVHSLENPAGGMPKPWINLAQ
jgi:hypothetical protein